MKIEQSLREMCTNIHVMEVSEGEEREKGTGKIVKEIMPENFPNIL